MRPELARLYYLEQHLLSTAPPDSTWVQQLLLDPALAADAAAQQHVYQALHEAGRQQLRTELQAIHRQLYGLPSAGWLRTMAGGLRTALRRFRL